MQANWLTPTQLADVLESGKYEKTHGTLYRPSDTDSAPAGYCCLGVLAVESGWSQAEVEKYQALCLDADEDQAQLLRRDGRHVCRTPEQCGDACDCLAGFEFAEEYPEPEWFHLDTDVEGTLVSLNDTNNTWAEVITYLRSIA